MDLQHAEVRGAGLPAVGKDSSRAIPYPTSYPTLPHTLPHLIPHPVVQAYQTHCSLFHYEDAFRFVFAVTGTNR